MSEDVKKKLVLCFFVFIIVGIITILISSSVKNKSNATNIYEFDDDAKLLSIKSTINSKLSILDKTYNINKIVCKDYENNNYCFINGYIIDYPSEEEAQYTDNVNYLMILRGNSYNIYEINTDNIDEYANNYNDFKSLDNPSILVITSYSEKIKIQNNISNFINLTMYDINKAYDLLSDKEKSKIGSLSNFKDNISKYQNISSNILSYDLKGDTYTISDNNKNTFKMIEKSSTNYKFELNQ